MRVLPLVLLLACADDVGVVKNYTPPAITFVEPVDGRRFLQGEAVTFRATVTDAQDEPTELWVTWQSDLVEAAFTVVAASAWDDDGDGWAEDQGDCNDDDESVAPGQVEGPNGDDDDCDAVTDEGTSTFDDDGDGLSEEAGDCDDTAASIFPGAAEVCDAVDQDCDTVTADSSWRVAGDDCDDADSDVHPDAEETCDGQDEDCDGTVDEADAVDATTWFLDADGDGHGDPTLSEAACSAPAGYVAVGDDCDDTNPSRNCPEW